MNDDLLIKFLLKETTPEEDVQVLDWIALSDENQKEFARFELIWNSSKKLEAELASARSEQPHLKDYVPRADYDATLARVVTLEKKAEDEKAAAHKAQVDVEIAQAMKDGKITPATKEFYAKTCATPEGLADFRAFCSSAPVIAPDDVVKGQPPAASPESGLTAQDFEVASLMGLTREQLIASVKN